MTEILDESSMFVLKEKKIGQARYCIKDTPIHVNIFIWMEDHIYVEWSIQYRIISINHTDITGEEAFGAIPDELKEDAVFHLDLFSLQRINDY